MKIQSLIYSVLVLIPLFSSQANIPTTVILPSESQSQAVVPSQPPVQEIANNSVSEIRSARLPTPDFDQDLNNLAGMESSLREGAVRQGKLKAAIRKQN